MYRYYSHVKYQGIDNQCILACIYNSNVDVSTVASVVSGVINALGLQSINSNRNDGSRDETSSSAHVQNSSTCGTVKSFNLVNRIPQFSKSYTLIW